MTQPDDGVLAEQWRSAAAVLREHADRFDARAEQAERTGQQVGSDIVRLLNEVDGLLGLAIHRKEGPHNPQWFDDAVALRTRIAVALKTLGRFRG